MFTAGIFISLQLSTTPVQTIAKRTPDYNIQMTTIYKRLVIKRTANIASS